MKTPPKPWEFVRPNSTPEFLRKTQEFHKRQMHNYLERGNFDKYQDLISHHFHNYLAYGGNIDLL